MGGGKPIVQTQTQALRLDGEMEVLAVDSKGSPTKVACTVKKFVHTDAKGADVLPAGTIVIATSSPGPRGAHQAEFSMKDGTLTPEQSAALSVVIDTHSPESATDDEIFGTDKLQKIGGTWTVHSAKAAADLGKEGMTIKPEDLKGDVTLAGVEKVAGEDYLRIRAHLTANNLTAPLPNDMKVAPGSKIEVEMTGLYVPGDGARASGTMDMNMEMRATGASPDGGAVALHVTMKGHKEYRSTPLKH